MTQKLAALTTGIFLCATLAFAAGSESHEIRVTLFGQPCLLQGPVSPQVLKAIHAISPEQIYPTFEPGEKSSSARGALEKLRASQEVPTNLDIYKEQLGKRLEAEVAFLSGLEESLRLKKSEPLLSKTKSFVRESRQKSFEATAKKLDGALTSAQRKEVVQQLFNSFSESLPRDPEEEFHKAIHRMKVQYLCSFEDSGEGDDSSE